MLLGDVLYVLCIQVILHGPFNPYELKCHSLTRISKFRYESLKLHMRLFFPTAPVVTDLSKRDLLCPELGGCLVSFNTSNLLAPDLRPSFCHVKATL